MNQVLLIHRDAEGLSIRLTAQIDDQGFLVLEGRDSGKAVRKCWGNANYRYRVTVPAAARSFVLVGLLRELFDRLDTLRDWLKGHQFRSPYLTRTELDSLRVDWDNPSPGPSSASLVDSSGEEARLTLLLIQEAFVRGLFESDTQFMSWLETRGIHYEFSG